MDERGSGWLLFASIVLLFAGIMRVLDSIWAFRFNGQLPDGLDGGVLGTNLTTYAWAYLIVGVVLILAGIYVQSRNQFFRWIGILAAIIGGLSGAVWLPYYPFWASVYIGIAILVTYALIAYGGREQNV